VYVQYGVAVRSQNRGNHRATGDRAKPARQRRLAWAARCAEPEPGQRYQLAADCGRHQIQPYPPAGQYIDNAGSLQTEIPAASPDGKRPVPGPASRPDQKKGAPENPSGRAAPHWDAPVAYTANRGCAGAGTLNIQRKSVRRSMETPRLSRWRPTSGPWKTVSNAASTKRPR
jgi:hypothetical protein